MKNYRRSLFLVTLAGLACLWSSTPSLLAQGCVCAHLITPGLGVEGTSTLPQGHWWTSVTFRYYNARQDVLGDEPLAHALIYANTHIYGFNLSATYAVTDRFDLTLDIPFQYGTRTTWIEHNFMSNALHTMRAGGIGDPRLRADLWLLEPRKSPERNISFALGVKIPVGEDDASDYAYRATGKVLRPVDPAIQPASGGWGIILGAHAFSSLFFQSLPSTSWLRYTYAYGDAIYIFTPEEMSDVENTNGDQPALTAGGQKALRFNSIPDQYLYRAGLSQLVWPSQGVSVSAGVRWEGIPAYDAIGGSNGFRLPGNAVSFEPGISIAHGHDYFSVSVPVAVHRHADRSEAFSHFNIGPPQGLATIADWQLIVSYAHQF